MLNISVIIKIWANGETDTKDLILTEIERYEDLRKWFVEYKSHLKCEVCNENHPATIEFHHKNPRTKHLEISVMVSSAPKFSREKIIKEMNKCKIICSNCHKKLHWKHTYV